MGATIERFMVIEVVDGVRRICVTVDVPPGSGDSMGARWQQLAEGLAGQSGGRDTIAHATWMLESLRKMGVECRRVTVQHDANRVGVAEYVS